MVCGEEGVEETTIKAPIRLPEVRVGGDHIADQIIRNVEPQPCYLLINQTPVNQLTKGFVNEAELLGLLEIDRAAKPCAQLLERATQGGLQLVGADAVVADRRDHRIGGTGAEDVPDPPNPEAQDQENE